MIGEWSNAETRYRANAVEFLYFTENSCVDTFNQFVALPRRFLIIVRFA
jgi:hypothetical protein